MLLAVLLIVAVGLLIVSALAELVWQEQYNQLQLANEWRAFYLAEAGIEKTKTLLAFFPLAYSDSTAPTNLPEGIVKQCNGYCENFSDGGYKAVRFQGKDEIYAYGWVGRSYDHPVARAFIMIRFSLSPFKTIHWERL